MTYKEYIKRNRISKITKQFGLLDDLMKTCIKDIIIAYTKNNVDLIKTKLGRYFYYYINKFNTELEYETDLLNNIQDYLLNIEVDYTFKNIVQLVENDKTKSFYLIWFILLDKEIDISEILEYHDNLRH
jgi:hypothetical protein